MILNRFTSHLSKLSLIALSAASALTSSAALVLNINPNSEGDWVLHLSGTSNGADLEFYNNLQNTSQWNASQGGSSTSVLVDSVESWSMPGLVNSSILDAIDVGDGKVIGNNNFSGLAALDTGMLFLKFKSTLGTGLTAFTSTTFNDTLTLKPTDKGSFLTVWNLGTYSNGDLTVNVSATAIPEPSTFAVLAGSCVLLLAVARRRRTAK